MWLGVVTGVHSCICNHRRSTNTWFSGGLKLLFKERHCPESNFKYQRVVVFFIENDFWPTPTSAVHPFSWASAVKRGRRISLLLFSPDGDDDPVPVSNYFARLERPTELAATSLTSWINNQETLYSLECLAITIQNLCKTCIFSGAIPTLSKSPEHFSRLYSLHEWLKTFCTATG